MNCKYCKNTFKTKGILSNHMKSAKYCLEIQKSIGITLSKNPYTCEFCKTHRAYHKDAIPHLWFCANAGKTLIAPFRKLRHNCKIANWSKRISKTHRIRDNVWSGCQFNCDEKKGFDHVSFKNDDSLGVGSGRWASCRLQNRNSNAAATDFFGRYLSAVKP